MTRLYFDCPIKALYMMKEFRVEFESFDWYSLINQCEHNKSAKCRYYITKGSEHIFEPMKGDEGRWSRIQGAHYANFNGVQWVSYGNEITEPEIIMRDNKHFFAPKKEEV